MNFSVGIFAHAARETLRISVRAIQRSVQGSLTPEDCDSALKEWSKRLLARANAQVEVQGLENLPQERPLILVSNHLSLYDIPVLIHALPLSLRMAGKKGLFSTPIWGRAMRVAGFVEIDRSSPEKAHQALERAGQEMKQNAVCLHIAPEGTRGTSASVQRFKRGAFELSLRTQIPVVPIGIWGTQNVLGKGQSQVRLGQRIQVELGKPMLPSSYEESRAFADAAHSWVQKSVERLSSQ